MKSAMHCDRFLFYFGDMEMILKQCESGSWIGWPKDREDILANGETKDECIENLKEMYVTVIEHEASEAQPLSIMEIVSSFVEYGSEETKVERH